MGLNPASLDVLRWRQVAVITWQKGVCGVDLAIMTELCSGLAE